MQATNRLYFIFFVLLYLSCILCSCSSANREQNKTGQNAMEGRPNDSLVVSTEATPYFQILHFWDHYDFTDTLAIQTPDEAEQTLVDFIVKLGQLTTEQASAAIKSMLDKAEVNHTVFGFFAEKYEYYLYHPNSPIRSDIYYEAVLEKLIQSETSTPTDKIRFSSRLELVRKNKVGSIATDFKYIMPSGEHANLHDAQENHKMLIFYDPGCSHCEETISLLRTSNGLNELVNDKMLQIIAICTLEDPEQWRQYQPRIPPHWTNGFDVEHVILKKNLYSLRAFPSIYLLNKDNVVILKDADWQHVLAFLGEVR